MMTIEIPDRKFWKEETQRFVTVPGVTLNLEHSLYAMSLWEAKWEVPYLHQKAPTAEQGLYYIYCMNRKEIGDFNILRSINAEDLERIKAYINAKQSATWFSKNLNKKKRSNEIITTELIYYWMSQLGIPFDPCEHWHFNRLMNLITIANIKQQPAKKMSKKQILSQNAAINAARRHT